MEPIGKLGSIDASNIGMLPSASKNVTVKFVDQSIHNTNHKEGLNGLKRSTKMKNRESLFKYQSRVYNFQRNSDVNHIGMEQQTIFIIKCY